MTSRVRELVQDSGVIAFLVLERFKGRELNVIGCRGVISLIAAVADGYAGGGDKLVNLRETIGKRQRISRLCVEVGGKPFDLLE